MQQISSSERPIQTNTTEPVVAPPSGVLIAARKAAYSAATAFGGYSFYRILEENALSKCEDAFEIGKKACENGSDSCFEELGKRNAFCVGKAGFQGVSIIANAFMAGLKERMIRGSLTPNAAIQDWKALEGENGTGAVIGAVAKNVISPYAIPAAESWGNWIASKVWNIPGYGGYLAQGGLVWGVVGNVQKRQEPPKHVLEGAEAIADAERRSKMTLTDHVAEIVTNPSEFPTTTAAGMYGAGIGVSALEPMLKETSEETAELTEKTASSLGFLSNGMVLSSLSSIGIAAYSALDGIIISAFGEKEIFEEETSSQNSLELRLAEGALVASKLGGIAALSLLPGPILAPLLGTATIMTCIRSLPAAANNIQAELQLGTLEDEWKEREEQGAEIQKQLKSGELSEEEKEIQKAKLLRLVKETEDISQIHQKIDSQCESFSQSSKKSSIEKDWNLIYDKDSSALGAAGYFSLEGVKNYYYPLQTAVDVVDVGYQFTKNTLCSRVSNRQVRAAVDLVFTVGVMTFGVEAITRGIEASLENYSIAEMTGMI